MSMNIKNAPSGNKSNTDRQNTAPGSSRDHMQKTNFSNLTGFGTVSPVSKELTEYKELFIKGLHHYLNSENLKTDLLDIQDLNAEINGVNFLYITYKDTKQPFAFCNYFSETYNKSDSIISGMNMDHLNSMNAFSNYNPNHTKNIETMDEKCKKAIKLTLDKSDMITVKNPYITNEIDHLSYNKVAQHAQNIVKQIISIYAVQSPDYTIQKTLPRNLKIGMNYFHGEKSYEIISRLYPNGITPRNDVSIVATLTDTSYDRSSMDQIPTSIAGVITGYMDFTKNDQQNYMTSSLYQQPMQPQYNPIFKITSVTNCGILPFMSLLMISYAHQFFCYENKWSMHMRDDNFMNKVANLGKLFTTKTKEGGKNEVVTFRKPEEFNYYLNPTNGFFGNAVPCLEIIDSHFQDPILKLIDLNRTSELVNYIHKFTNIAIPENSIQNLIYGQTTNILGTISQKMYNSTLEIDSRYYSTYLDLIQKFPEVVDTDDIKMFLYYNDEYAIRRTNFIDHKVDGGFNKKFKCHNTILNPHFLKLMAKIISESGINIQADNSFNGSMNFNTGSLNIGSDFFSDLNGMATMGNFGSSFNIQSNNPFATTTPFSI